MAVDPIRSVKKRDGRIEDFDKSKLFEGIIKAHGVARPRAGRAIAIDLARTIYKAEVRSWVSKHKKDLINAKDLQIQVENALMKYCPDIARVYIIEGYKKEVARKSKKGSEE